MEFHHLTYRKSDHIALVTLDNPATLNAMTGQMLASFSRAIELARHDDDVRVLVVTGAGRGFCAGADLSGGSGTFDRTAGGEGSPGKSAGSAVPRDGGGLLTLRIYESKGLVRPGRTPGGTRLYSEHDLDRLRLIQRLTTELGLNLAGVARVLALEDELARLRTQLDRLEREMRESIERVHRQYRRDLVLYRDPAASPFPVPRRRRP